MEKEKEKLRRAVPKFGSFKPTTAPEPASDTRSTSAKPVRKADDGGKETRRRDGLRGEDNEPRRHYRRHEHESERGQNREHRSSDRERERHHDRRRERSRERERDRGPSRGTERGQRSKREDERSHDRHVLRASSPKELSRGNERGRGDPSSLSNDLFVLDKRGDRLIVQYGSNDRAEVPAYYRFGAGRIIGSPGFLTIHREGAQEQFSIRDPGEGSGSGSAFRDKALVAAARRAQSRLIKPVPGQSLPTASDDFISLDSSRKRKRSSDHSPAREQPTPNYRSIYGKATSTTNDSSADSDSDSSSSSSSSSRSRPPSSSRSRPPSPSPKSAHPPTSAPATTNPQSRATALSSHVKSHPTDIPAWLDLIALQEPLFRHNRSHFHSTNASPLSSSYWPPLTPDETRALAELRLALYKEALPHANDAKDRERLVLGMMREGGRVWDEGVLSRRWEEVVKQQQQGRQGNGGGGGGVGFALWRARVDFEMGRVGVFAVEEVRGLVVERLREVAARLQMLSVSIPADGNGAEAEEVEELCREAVYVFLRLTRLLQDAGYVELAVAAWQAVLEMAFYRPPAAADWDAESALAAFADFWESEVVRVGEEGAKGWRHFVEAGGAMAAEPPDAKTDKPAEVPQMRDPLQAWAAVEQQAAERARMPARTLDEGTEDDPFRVVMYSDIKDLLLWLPTVVLPQAQPLLVDAFLVFSGLPVSGVAGETFASLLDDPYVAAKGPGLNLDQEHDASLFEDLSKRRPDFGQQGGSMAISPEVLFAGHSWFRYLDEWSDIHQAGDHQVDGSWVLRTLKGLVKDAGMEQLAEYYLAMEWLHEPAGTRKIARGLLKQYSSNLRLYNAYALLESANGNNEISHKVLSSATQLAPVSASSGGQLLWKTWAWIYLEAGQKQEALTRLCSSADRGFQGSVVAPAMLLKAKSYFSTTRDYSLSSQQLEVAAQHAESLMLLEYLSTEVGSESASETQGNLSAALESVHTFSRELQSRNQATSPHHERLLQSAARLLYHHASHGPYRPTTLRAHLESFTRLFPRNAIFLTLLAWFHPSLLILDDPVRHLLRTVTLTPPHDSLAARRFAIRHEARTSGGGTVHAVRAAFEAALLGGGSEVCWGNAGLWVDYIRFCRGHEGELRGKAREVFYRAIAACPGAKEVYMEGFAVEGLAREELRAVVETMVAKGLRVHVDLEEFLRGWK